MCEKSDFIPYMSQAFLVAGYDASCSFQPAESWNQQDDVLWIGDHAPSELSSRHVFQAGFRMGQLFDQIDHMMAQVNAQKTYNFGRFRLDMKDHYICVLDIDGDQHQIVLTDTEKKLFEALIKAEGRPLSREYLMKDVWSYQAKLETHTVETHIYRLRQKLDRAGGFSSLLQTSDAGYFLDE